MTERLRQLEIVGRGGMAEVYRGVLLGERGTRRDVAIKRLRPDLRNDSAAVELFVNEARLAVRLSHPNVMHALELARDDDGYALVCEWLDCASLVDLHHLFGPLPLAAVLHVGRSVCGALDYLHHLDGGDGSVVHRDVTPANVFVTCRGQVKLGDFGVAWCRDESSFVEVKAAGTPGFAAPEQTAAGSVDARTDVFGLGASLAVLSEDPPASLASVLQRASALDPTDRFDSAIDFDDALAGVARELAVEVGPKALHSWLDAHGGIPRRPPPPSLDGAVQSILSGVSGLGDEPTTDEHRLLVPAPPPVRRWSRTITVSVAAVVLIVAAVSLLYLRSGPFAWPSDIAAPTDEHSETEIVQRPESDVVPVPMDAALNAAPEPTASPKQTPPP
ncbi:MAG: serine/threonine-protein kinase, partial [Myxococcota bacterium]